VTIFLQENIGVARILHFFPQKLDDLFAKTAKLTNPTIQPSLPSKKNPSILTSCSARGGALTTYSYKLRPKVFFSPWGHVNPVNPLPTGLQS